MAQYNWSRYWIPRGTDVILDSDGFVPDPGSPYRFDENKGIVSYEEIAETPCLVLLGEPGMGKTTTIHDLWEKSKRHLQGTGNTPLFFDLGEITSESVLRDSVFNHPAIQTWRSSSTNLILFLDSLDESRERIRTVCRLIVSQLRDFPLDRLFLRIACRSAVFPATFEAHLKNLFPNEGFGIFELVPLSVAEITEAAKVNEIDPDSFLCTPSPT